jgi:hypothetical protein
MGGKEILSTVKNTLSGSKASPLATGVTPASSGGTGGNPVSKMFDTLAKDSAEAEKTAKAEAERNKNVVNAIFDSVENMGSEILVDAGIAGGNQKAQSQRSDSGYSL